MLVLSRLPDESVIIDVGGKIIRVTILEIRPNSNKVRIGFTADKEVIIHREEVYEQAKEMISKLKM